MEYAKLRHNQQVDRKEIKLIQMKKKKLNFEKRKRER